MISVVIPCYNEREVLPQLYARMTAAAEAWGEPFEVVLVNDGSHDDSWDMMREFHRRDPRWKAIRFARNFGHQTAVSAGLHYAGGDAVIVIDADLQDPPEELRRFIAKWREGYEVVYAVRTQRKEGVLLKLGYKVFYRLLARLANIRIPLDSGDFSLMDRKVVDALEAMPERNRFVRGLRSWAGFRQVGLEYERQPRAAGAPKYTLRKLVKLAMDGILSFSTAPLRLSMYFGFACSLVALVGAAYTLLERVWLAPEELSQVRGFTTIIISILFLGGVQLMSLGVIGEYIGRIYDEVKGRPPWIIQEMVGIDLPTAGRADAATRASR